MQPSMGSARVYNRGYTLIELIVSISVMVIMLGIVVGSYYANKTKDTVKFETDKLASVLRNARSRSANGVRAALASKACSVGSCSVSGTACDKNSDCPAGNSCDYAGCSADIDCQGIDRGHCANARFPAGGWGVSITNGGFPGGLGDSAYDLTADFFESGVGASVIESFSLPKNLTFNLPGNAHTARVFFTATTTQVFICYPPADLYECTTKTSLTPFNIITEHKTTCSALGKRGTVTIDRPNKNVFEQLASC